MDSDQRPKLKQKIAGLTSLARFLLIVPIIVVIAVGPTAHAQITQCDINDLIGENPYFDSCAFGGGSCSLSALSGSDNAQKAFNFFTGKRLIAAQASGIIGNLEQESGQGINPLDQQNPNHSAITVPIPNEGFGIAQWTDPGRQQGLVSFAQQQGGAPGDLDIQLNYLWYELTTNYKGTYSQLQADNNPTDPTQATTDFMNGYEGPGRPHLDNRIKFAKDALALYGGSVSSGVGGATCVGASVNCNAASPATTGLSQVRQDVVCIAQQELASWDSQPGYGDPYPGFPYAQTGLLKYTGGGYEEWCADFVSWVYNQANYPFSGGLSGGWRLYAVAAIQNQGLENSAFHWHPVGDGYQPKPGDIAIRGTSHVNIFISSAGGIDNFIGGDQGSGPYGQANPPENGAIVSQDSNTTDITGYVSPD